jgi:hypothetical protein
MGRGIAAALVAGAVVAPVSALGLGVGPVWADAPGPAVSGSSAPGPVPGLHARVFATGGSWTDPDEVVPMDGMLFVDYQNGVGPTGLPSATGATRSTIVEYSGAGKVEASWSVAGHCDGLLADASGLFLVGTVNEDGSSSAFEIFPFANPPEQFVSLSYQPGTLPHGGGTDSIVQDGWRYLISASAPAPAPADVPAVYVGQIVGGTVDVSSLFSDTATATLANVGADEGSKVALALTDPDSSIMVPWFSPRFAGDFLLDSQGDGEQVYVSDPGGPHQRLSVLDLSQSVDDTVWAPGPYATLYASDAAHDTIWAVTGGFAPGTAVTAVTPGDANTPGPGPNYLGLTDMATGKISPLGLPQVEPKSLSFTFGGWPAWIGPDVG